MKIILFGATGMVGQGVLRECLADPDIAQVLIVGRSSIGQSHPKLREIIHKNFEEFSTVETELSGYDACFFCLGVSSAGMTEQAYRHVTYDFTLAAAKLLAKLNPNMTFIYVSGMGTDSTEKGRTMWARVKGETENALLRLPFKAAYMFRPGGIEPLDGIKPKNKWLRMLLVVMGPLFPLFKRLFPDSITTTRKVGRAMIKLAKDGDSQKWIESRDINRLGQVPETR
jgi:uncharacterized protein YbjT (DUF2867 family)